MKRGQICFVEEGEGGALVEASTVMGLGARAGNNSSWNNKAISAAISKMVNDMVEIYNALIDYGHPKENLKMVIDEKGQHRESSWRKRFPDVYRWLLFNE